MDATYKEKAGKNVMTFIKKFEKHGPRLPGSPEEKKAADALVKEIKLQTGLDAKKEEFVIHPHSGVGSIPLVGALAYVALLFFFLSAIPSLNLAFGIVAAVLMTFLWVFAVAHVFRNKTWFDFLFPKTTSNNVVATIPARSGKHDFTIIYSGHLDSSWNWNLAAYGSPAKMIPLVALGIVGALAFFVICYIKLFGDMSLQDYGWLTAAGIICGITFFPLCIFLSYNKKKASPGAMDNLTGIGLALEVIKYYKNNPGTIPDNCRLMFAGLGCEEAGLRGSFAYVKEHFGKEGDDTLVKGKTYVLNIDSIADKDDFEVVQGDIWQTTFFPKKMCDMAFEAMTEAGVNPKRIYNPIGGCDSTPFHKKGIDTVTLAAQDPVASSYYHTFRDVSSRFDEGVVANGFDVLLRLTDKVVEYHNNK
ncbi:MAG: Zn-dependent exopeptidase M28 [Clostridiales bacterium]|jgi:hypothetical protein|nr:Zn-dependent exopeptidase M28 [Clostridiales bacterium]